MKISTSLLLAAGALQGALGLQCLDQDLKSVDWWFVYKMHDGVRYAYKDSNDATYSLDVQVDDDLSSGKNAFGGTLDAFYQVAKDTMYVMYNDEFPGSDLQETEGAHAKGVFATEENGGFWLIHSIPKFPEDGASSYSYTGATEYGQTALCISLDAKNTELIAQQLQYMGILKYGKNAPDSLASSFPHFNDLINGAKITTGTNIQEFKSLNGHEFTSFAKYETWGKDLYEDLVEPYWEQGFRWETWRRSPFLDTYCTPDYDYDSINVEEMSFTSTDGKETFDFAYTCDHAKWGLAVDDSSASGARNATSSNSYLVCVGGINRMDSQRERGGQTTCFSRSAMWNALDRVIADEDRC